MSDANAAISQIMDEIASGMIDDPIEDYKYLQGEVEKYQSHELAEEISREVAKLMFSELPAAARNELTGSHEAASFSFMLDQAEGFLCSRKWFPAGVILQNLIGEGIAIEDTDNVEFRSFDEKQKVQSVLYEKFFKSEKKVVRCPVDLGKLYGLFGVVLVERKDISTAQKALAESLHYNPLDYNFFFEYCETFKLTKDFGKLEQLSREYLKYAYKAADIGHLYRNLGYVYTEKKDYETAIALYQFAMTYDSEHSDVSEKELAYIAHVTGRKIEDPTQEQAEAPLKREDIQIGASLEIQKLLYVQAKYFSDDVETTDYYCDLLYDVTRDEEFVEPVRAAARKPKAETATTVGSSWADFHPYEDARDAALKKVFPNFPDITECRLQIEFTVGSTKYAETIDQILEQIDDLCKAVDGKHVSLVFPTLDSVKKNIMVINDVIGIAGSWKSFEISINGGIMERYTFTNYFMNYIGMRYSVRSADEIRKVYKKASAPPRVKKERPEDAVVYTDLDKLTPKELFHGIIKTYADVYLKEHEVQTHTINDKEIVLVADNDLVVDFWMANQSGGPMGSGYHSWEYVIQELTPNQIFKYNHSAFHHIFREACIRLDFVKYQYPKMNDGPLNHFNKVNSALPELKLKERCSSVPLDPYSFVVVQMANADGSVGYGIGYTAKDSRSLLLKICKNLETANPYGLDKRGIPGLDIQNSVPFFKAFQSWKGGKKTERLQNYLKYYVIEKIIKADYEIRPTMDEIMRGIKTGQYDGVSWNTYDDIGRRSKK